MFLNYFQQLKKFLILYFFFLSNPSKLFFDFSSIDKGETAKGNGFKLPLVISTSIKPNDFMGINKIIKNDIKKNFCIIHYLTFQHFSCIKI